MKNMQSLMKKINKRKLPSIDSEILLRRMSCLVDSLKLYMTGTKYDDSEIGRICGLIEGYLAAFEVFERGSTIETIRLEVNHKLFGFVYQKYESYQAAIYRIASEFLTKYPPIFPDDDQEAEVVN